MMVSNIYFIYIFIQIIFGLEKIIVIIIIILFVYFCTCYSDHSSAVDNLNYVQIYLNLHINKDIR